MSSSPRSAVESIRSIVSRSDDSIGTSSSTRSPMARVSRCGVSNSAGRPSTSSINRALLRGFWNETTPWPLVQRQLVWPFVSNSAAYQPSSYTRKLLSCCGVNATDATRYSNWPT